MESGQETTREDQQSSQPLTSTSTEGYYRAINGGKLFYFLLRFGRSGKEAKEAKEAKKEDIDEKTQKQKQSSGVCIFLPMRDSLFRHQLVII